MSPPKRNDPQGCTTTPRGRSKDQITKATTPVLCSEDSAAARQHDAAKWASRSAALDLAASGKSVFACKPGSKEPATVHGFKDGTTDPRGIYAQFGPYDNLAIPTGELTFDVLDVDVKPGGTGWAALDRLKRAGLLVGALATVRTPSGGLHIYYRGTAQLCGRLPGHFLDFKATGGYVLVPPSVVNGRPYEWLDRRTDGAGRRLVWDAVRSLLEPPRAAPVRPVVTRDGGIGALAGWLAQQREGNRNNALYWAACRAVEEGHGDDLDVLVAAAVQAGLDERGARGTVNSAARRIAGVA